MTHPLEYFPSHVDVRGISSALNPFVEDGVGIYAVTAGPNIKMYPALSMLWRAQERGELVGVHTLVENSSGNMALALGLLGPQFGIKKVVAIVPADSPSGKLDPIRLSRIEPKFHTELPDEPSGIQLARKMGVQKGWLNLAQYENEEGNSGGTYHWVAPEVLRRLQEMPQIISAGVGTGGTVIGFSRFFKERATDNPPHVIGVRVAPDAAVPGVRSEKRLVEVRNHWREAVDEIVDVGTRESYLLSRALWWDIGCHVGPSSGFALAGLLASLSRIREEKRLDAYRDRHGIIRALFICPDSAYPYWDKYSTILDAKDLA